MAFRTLAVRTNGQMKLKANGNVPLVLGWPLATFDNFMRAQTMFGARPFDSALNCLCR